MIRVLKSLDIVTDCPALLQKLRDLGAKVTQTNARMMDGEPMDAARGKRISSLVMAIADQAECKVIFNMENESD